MIRRTASGKAKNGITRSQLRRQLWAMAGYFCHPMAGVESIERRLGRISILRPINRLQRAGEGFAVLPGGEIHRMADQMDDARLNDRLRKDGVDRLRKALQSVDDCDQNVIDARGSSARSSPAARIWRLRYFRSKGPGYPSSHPPERRAQCTPPCSGQALRLGF